MDRHNYICPVSFENLSKKCSDITYRNKKCYLVIPWPTKCLLSPDSNGVPSLMGKPCSCFCKAALL